MADSLKSSILVIPAVSSGNIPQLAVDLLIHTLNAPLVTRLSDEHVYPIAGARDVPSGQKVPNKSVTTAVEVYHARGITFVQIRSPTLPGHRTKFVKETILPFVAEHKFRNTVVVGSATPGLQLDPSRLRFKVFSDSSVHSELVERFKLLSLDHGQAAVAVEKVPDKLDESGIIVDVMKTVESACGVVMYAYEGDNFQDAEELAEKLTVLLDVKNVKGWKRPESWKGAYGRDVSVGLEEGLYA